MKPKAKQTKEWFRTIWFWLYKLYFSSEFRSLVIVAVYLWSALLVTVHGSLFDWLDFSFCLTWLIHSFKCPFTIQLCKILSKVFMHNLGQEIYYAE